MARNIHIKDTLTAQDTILKHLGVTTDILIRSINDARGKTKSFATKADYINGFHDGVDEVLLRLAYHIRMSKLKTKLVIEEQ